MITLSYFGAARELTGRETQQIQAASLGQALDYIEKAYGKAALKAVRASMLTVNGARVEKLMRRMPLPPGCVLGVYPLCCGG